ncbi:MAG: carcinine hydrolase/isopenicillin-N N-acyltransferase family protein [Candidatus Thorarchaeota archaeon]
MYQKQHYSRYLLLLIVLSSMIIPYTGGGTIYEKDMTPIGLSCTIFTVAIGNTVLFGNNEDYLQRDLHQWYIPSQNITIHGEENKTIHGGVFVGFINSYEGGIYPQGGMNEYGLMYDLNGLPALDLNQNSSGAPFYTDNFILCESLWDCKDVEQVIAWFKNHKWDFPIGGQIHYADASGDAVVISVNPSTEKWAFTRKNSSYLVSTNFNLNDTSNGDYPCERYNTATQMLSEITSEENLTVQACADVLYAVHSEGMYGTLYSNIFDPVNLDIYFNHGDNYQNQVKGNLLDTLSEWESFEQKDSFFDITGIQGHLLVKSVRLNESFYTPPTSLSTTTTSLPTITTTSSPPTSTTSLPTTTTTSSSPTSTSPPSLPPSFYILAVLAIGVIIIPLAVYIHKRK